MGNIPLLLMLLFVAAQTLIIAGFFLLAARKFRRIEAGFREFVTPPAENEPSPLNQATDAISSQFARAMSAQVKSTLMGMASGEARQALSAHNEEVRQGGLGGVLDAMPGLKKKKYQGVLDLAMMFLANKIAPAGNGNHQGSIGEQPKFRL